MGDAPRIEAPVHGPMVVVHQAVGMTMEYLDCSGQEAFAALIARAGETGRSPMDVAADVVERRFRFGQHR